MRQISSELYRKYRQQVLDLSLAVQEYDGTRMKREENCLTDREIAKRLGLAVHEVTEIRCIAEVDLIPPETWMESDRWKRDRIQKKLLEK
jgi:hypothetical protein